MDILPRLFGQDVVSRLLWTESEHARVSLMGHNGREVPVADHARRAPLYVPILRGRRGEFDALEMMNATTRSATYPLIEVVHDVEVSPLKTGELMRTFGKLALKWMGPIMLDGFNIARPAGSGANAIRLITDAARGLLQVVPVVRLEDDVGTWVAAASAAEEDGNGIAIRVTTDQLDGGTSSLVEEVARWLRVPLDLLDVILDLALIGDRAAVARGTRIADRVAGELSRHAGLRTIVVAAGSFPVDLRDVMPWTFTEKIRHDADLWGHLVDREPDRIPVFGDYGIAHPVMLPPPSGFPAPQLRYTLAGRWLILRGRRNDHRSHGQFYDICERIRQHPEFSGADLGEADDRIANAGRAGPGNATTWRTLGTAHHADFVVARLADGRGP